MAAKTLNKNYLDMTAGPILAALVRFSVPMMIGGLFQDLYSMVDMTIAGYTLGDHAIAAISASAAILNMMNYSAAASFGLLILSLWSTGTVVLYSLITSLNTASFAACVFVSPSILES